WRAPARPAKTAPPAFTNLRRVPPDLSIPCISVPWRNIAKPRSRFHTKPAFQMKHFLSVFICVPSAFFEKFLSLPALKKRTQINTEENALTEGVIGAVLEVSNILGAGFLEKLYPRALLRELGLRGIRATAEASFPVSYKGQHIGEYYADILIEDVPVVELK